MNKKVEIKEYHGCGTKMETIFSSKFSDLEITYCPKCLGKKEALKKLHEREISGKCSVCGIRNCVGLFKGKWYCHKHTSREMRGCMYPIASPPIK